MSHLTRRSLVSLLAIGAVQTLAKGQEAAENQEVSPEEILKKIPTHWIAIGKLTSSAGLAFERELFREMLLEIYSSERVGEKKSSQAAAKIPREIGMVRSFLISKFLEIDKSEVEYFKRPTFEKFSQEQWDQLANKMSLEDAVHLQVIVFKLQLDRAAQAIGRSKHASDIGKTRQDHGESLTGVKKALGLYVDPKGDYGLGGSEDNQLNARQCVYAARNFQHLSGDEVKVIVGKVLPAYLPSVEEAIKHYDQICQIFRIKNLNSELVLGALASANKKCTRPSITNLTQINDPSASKPSLQLQPQR